MASIKKRATAKGDRYDVRYRLVTGEVRTKTCRTKKEAHQFAAITEADKARGGLVDPRAGRLRFGDYSEAWLDDRPDLRPRTVELYRGLLRLHLLPDLGSAELAKITPERVRRWQAARLKAGVSETTTAKAYRLLRTILGTAVDDGRIVANPCRLKGAGRERTAERPTVTPADVFALADAVPDDHRCMVLLAGVCGLRLGEVLGLAVRHVDLLHGTVTVERQLQELGSARTATLTDPKSDAGRRVVPLPATVANELRVHLETRGAVDPEAFLFVGVKGGPVRRCVWQKEWNQARAATGHGTLRFHDLRHSALTLLAATGATVAELQAHAGHASPAAALRYQHATADRAKVLADLVDRAIRADDSRDGGSVRAMDAR